MAHAAFAFGVEGLLETTPVEEPRENDDLAPLLDDLVKARRLDGRGRMRGEHLDDLWRDFKNRNRNLRIIDSLV
jgi:hypothetical protein